MPKKISIFKVCKVLLIWNRKSMKLFRDIRQSLIKDGKLKRYLIYAIGEILLVMIGISLAFQVNNWNDNRIKKNTEIRYYENVRDQIGDDKELIERRSEEHV